MHLRDYQKECHSIALSLGWWDQPRELPEILCLIHSEVSEALEHYRNGKAPQEVWRDEKGKPDGIGIELADVIIRVLDYADYAGIDLESLLQYKMTFNKTRPYRHGKTI